MSTTTNSASITTRVNVTEIGAIRRALSDVSAQLRPSKNHRFKAAATVLNDISVKLLDASGVRGSVARPSVVCLCGSTRFFKDFAKAGLSETMAGKIVLSLGAAVATNDFHFGHLPERQRERILAGFYELHLRKIEISDEILVINVDGYIGEATAKQIAYAQKLGRKVRYLEDPATLSADQITDKLQEAAAAALVDTSEEPVEVAPVVLEAVEA